MARRRLHAFFSGRVQGVGFRYTVKSLATGFEATGMVRNLPDGRVAAVFEGDREKIDSMLAWCWEGPPYAAVDEILTDWQPHRGEFQDFGIDY